MHTEDEADASDSDVQDLGVFPLGGAHAAEPGASSDRPFGLDDDDDEGVEDLGVFSSPQRGYCTDSEKSANDEPASAPRGGVGLMLESSSMRVTRVLEGSVAREVGVEAGARQVQ